MSKTVDERVVEMRFDNSQFEKNVSTTMSTLDKFKQKLNFSGASKGLDDISKSAKKVDLSSLSAGAEAVEVRFSHMQATIQHQLDRLVDKLVDTGIRMAKALTIDPVTTGFEEYETQINAVQTILANTKSKGSTIEDVNNALNELNTYADLTIYNFTEMTRNIGTFTAAGVDLETSVAAIQGIANLAAVSGSTSQQASTAMYQLSQALAAGKIQLMDWNSVVNAGMGGEVFQNALKRTATVMGTNVDAMIEKYGSFRESLTKGEWLTSEVLTKTLEQFTMAAEEGSEEWNKFKKSLMEEGYTEAQAQEILEMANTATDAATKIKTFTQLWDVLKETAQSGWTQTWNMIIGDYEEAIDLLSPLGEFLQGVIDGFSKLRNDVLESALGKSFSGVLDNVKKIVDPVKKSADSVKEVVDSVKDYASVVDEIIGGKWGNGQDRWDKLTQSGYDWAHAQNLVNEKLGNAKRHTTDYTEAQSELAEAQGEVAETQSEISEATVDYIVDLVSLSDAQLKEKGYTEEQIKSFRELAKAAEQTGIPLKDFITNIDEIDGRYLLINSFKNAGLGLVTVCKSIGQAWKEAFHGDASDEEILEKRSEKLYSIIAALHKFSTHLIVGDETAKKLTRTFKGLFAIVDIISTIVGGGFKVAFKLVSQVLKYFDTDILSVTANIGDAIVGFRDWLESITDITKVLDILIPIVTEGAEAVKGWFGAFAGSSMVQDFLNKITLFCDEIKNMDFEQYGQYIVEGFQNGIVSGTRSVISTIIKLATDIIKKFCDIFLIHSPSVVMQEIGEFIIQGLVKGISGGVQSVLDGIKYLGNVIINAFKGIDVDPVFLEKIKAAFEKFRTFLKEFDYAKLLAIIPIAVVIMTVKKVFGLVDAFANGINSLNGVIDSFAEVGQSLAKVTKAFALNIKTKALKNIAISIAILAGSIFLLTFADTDKLYDAVGIIVILAGVLAALAFAMSKMSDASVTLNRGGLDIKGLRNNLISIGVAILLLAATVKLIGSMDPNEAERGFKGLAEIAVGLGVFIAAMSAVTKGDATIKNIDKVGSMVLKLSIAMALMVGVCKLISKLSAEEMLQGGVFAIAFALFVRSITSVAKGSDKSISKVGNLLIKVSIAIVLMIGVCKLASKLSAEEMFKGAAFATAFVIFIKALVKITTVGNDQQIAKLGGLLLSISISLIMMVGICKLAGKLSKEEMLKGAAFVTAFLIFVKALVKITTIGNEQQIAKVSGTILAMSIAIGVMAIMAILLGMVRTDLLAKGVIAVGVLGLVMAAMIKATKGASNVKGNLIVMTIAIAVMVGAVAALSMIDGSKLAGATAALGSLMGIFALMIFASTKIKTAGNAWLKNIAVIASLAGVVVLLSFVIKSLAQLNPENAIGAAISLGTLMLALSGSMLIISKSKGLKLSDLPAILASVAMMTLVAAAITELIYCLRNCDPATSIGNALALTMLMTAMTVLLFPLKSIGNNVGDAAKGVIALTAMVIPLTVFAVALSKIPDVSDTQNNILTLTTLMTAMTLLLIPLTIIGNFAVQALGGVIALTAMVVPLAAFAVALSKIPDVSGARSNIINLTTIMTAMTLLLIPLTIIGAFVLAALAGVISLTAMVVPLVAFAIALSKIPDVTGQIDNIAVLASFMTIITNLLFKISIVAPLAVIAVVAITALCAVIVAFGTLSTAIGFLMEKCPFLEEFLNKGMQILAGIAEGLGTVIGKFITGFTNEIMTILPNLGTCLSQFMMNLQPFIVSANMVQDNLLEKVGILTGAILLLTVASFIEGITSLFGVGLSDLGTELQQFAMSILPFVATMMMIDPSAVEAAKRLSELVLALAGAEFLNGITNIINKLPFFDEAESLGDKLVSFAGTMVQFSNAITQNGDINTEAISRAATAGKAMVDLANAIPKSGGFLQDVVGEADLEKFGNMSKAFGKAIKEMSDALSGENGETLVNQSAIDSAVNAGKSMTEVANAIPKSGGFLQDVVGESDLELFGTRVKAFGKAIKEMSDALSGENNEVLVNDGAINSAVKAGKAMSDLANALPKSDGFLQDVVGEQDLEVFGTRVKAFGDAIKEMSDALSGEDGEILLNMTAIESAKTAGISMTEIANAIPKDTIWDGKVSIDDFGKKILKFGQYLSDYSGEIVESDLTGIATSITEANRLVSLTKKVVDLDTSGITNFSNVTRIADTMSNYATKVAEMDTNVVAGSISSAFRLRNFIASLVDLDSSGVSNFKIGNIGTTMKSYATSVADMDTSVVAGSISCANRLRNFIASLVDLDSSGVSNFKLGSIGGTIKSYAASVAEIDTSTVGSSISLANRLRNFIANLVDLDSSGISNFKLGFIGSSIKNYANSVSDIDAGSVSSSISLANRLKNFISSLSGLDTSGASSFKTAINTLGQVNFDSFAKAFSGSTPKLTSVGSKMMNSLITGVKSKQSTLTNTAKSSVTSMVNAAKNQSSTFRTLGVQLITNFIQGINSQKSKTKTSMTSVLKTMVTTTRNYYKNFYNAGSYLVDGFADGITANTFKAKAKAVAMAKAALKAAEEALGIASPSKEFYKVGDFAGQGFINALSDYGRDSYSAGSEMADSARLGLNTAMNKVYDLINGDMDMQPTIRPVLDLSDVSTGAGAISGLFNNPSIGVMSNVGAISSMMNKNQNGTNNDIISAINKLRDDLGNSRGDTYQINGITYDDGSNISEAVSTLVRAARMERRI